MSSVYRGELLSTVESQDWSLCYGLICKIFVLDILGTKSGFCMIPLALKEEINTMELRLIEELRRRREKELDALRIVEELIRKENLSTEGLSAVAVYVNGEEPEPASMAS